MVVSGFLPFECGSVSFLSVSDYLSGRLTQMFGSHSEQAKLDPNLYYSGCIFISDGVR